MERIRLRGAMVIKETDATTLRVPTGKTHVMHGATIYIEGDWATASFTGTVEVPDEIHEPAARSLEWALPR